VSRRALASLLTLVVVGVAGCLYPGAEVPYVLTPHEVVGEMLRLAVVGPRDVVYDLGSGDGRVVIAAARDFGARGVGVEIDPKLVAESVESARRAGVADRVTFRAGDLFQTDLGEATVVTLYLSPELHDFDMGYWPPTQTIRVHFRERGSVLRLWIVPRQS